MIILHTSSYTTSNHAFLGEGARGPADQDGVLPEGCGGGEQPGPGGGEGGARARGQEEGQGPGNTQVRMINKMASKVT